MAGGEENGPEGSLGEPLPPPDEPSQPLAEGFPEERPRPGGEDEQEEKGEEEESERSEDHLEVVLDEDTAAEGLHTFGRSACGTEYVYLHLSLPGRGLSDISILSGYIHLQKMELSSNKINDLSCVSHMPYLVELNASKNKLTTYFNFRAPKNLREVDFSHNHIPKMKDLSEYHSLTKLLLDFNEIEEIRGLEECHSLTQLGLSHNRLAAIRGLHNLPVRVLNLSFNQIEKVDGLKSLKNLQCVNLSNNKINSLRGLEEHDLLEAINLEDNQVAELSELKWIEDLPLLRDLNLLKNPLQEKGSYWLSAIFMLLQVTHLDLKKVSVEEKVAAVNKEAPPPEVVAAEDHRTQLLYHSLQPQGILNSTLPAFDDPYPMLVLLGPVAGGRRQLSLKLCRQFKTFFRFGPCHTTRKAYFGEENRLDYHFISEEEFDKMVKAGRFLATYKYSGHRYGLARGTLESIAREGLATCVHMEIEGVRSLKRTHFRPRCILLVPKDKEKYGEHLRRTGLFSRPEMEEAVSRVDMYLQISQHYPGYFDAVINTDDLEKALTDLSLVVKVYLGMEPPNVLENFEGLWGRTGSWNQIIPEEMPVPSYGDLLHISAKNYPRDLLEMLTATPGSVEEASLRRRFSAARQVLLSHRALDPECEASLQLLPRPAPPLPSGASRVPSESSSRRGGGAGRVPPAEMEPRQLRAFPRTPLPLQARPAPNPTPVEEQRPLSTASLQPCLSPTLLFISFLC
ncbi:leucine-rich repeat and guanylate kinase domain-containing protein isoform X2 [Molothrus aeneus]|uniref:leucine-rich repeat and guanylate kinase domain-containing protein isoform X2 n=1 Tax=Molothrus aeneus TaxID=84833 RepID=UPI00345952FB